MIYTPSGDKYQALLQELESYLKQKQKELGNCRCAALDSGIIVISQLKVLPEAWAKCFEEKLKEDQKFESHPSEKEL